MLREGLQRWVGNVVSGSVTLRLRRGQDFTIVDTQGSNFSYHPEKLSMERSQGQAFFPGDRIGQLTMRNLDIADSRSKLEQYAAQNQLTAWGELIGELPAGGADAIAASGPDGSVDSSALDHAAIESGTD